MSTLKIKLNGPGTGSVELDGRDISLDVVGLLIDLEVGRENVAAISYRCEEVEIEGSFEVKHSCGLLSLGE